MIQREIMVPIEGAMIFKQINVSPSKGVLITGPPGSGKTAIGLAICRQIY
jgi:ATP-dependent 26S proteasome regulatory subunit